MHIQSDMHTRVCLCENYNKVRGRGKKKSDTRPAVYPTLVLSGSLDGNKRYNRPLLKAGRPIYGSLQNHASCNNQGIQSDNDNKRKINHPYLC